MRGPSSLLLLLCLLALPREAAATCVDEVTVMRASVTYETRLFRGQPTRRDARIAVDLRSTSTTAVGRVELGLFLGATLEDLSSTRGSALPTRQPRTFSSGGLAWRAEVPVLLPAGATRTVTVEKKALPLDQDLYGVKAIVVGCARLEAVGELQLTRRPGSGDPPTYLLLAALILTAIIAVVVVGRLR